MRISYPCRISPPVRSCPKVSNRMRTARCGRTSRFCSRTPASPAKNSIRHRSKNSPLQSKSTASCSRSSSSPQAKKTFLSSQVSGVRARQSLRVFKKFPCRYGATAIKKSSKSRSSKIFSVPI